MLFAILAKFESTFRFRFFLAKSLSQNILFIPFFSHITMLKRLVLLAAMGVSFGSFANQECYIQANSGSGCDSTTGGVVDIGRNTDQGKCIGIAGKAPRYSFYSNCPEDLICVFYVEAGCNGDYYRNPSITPGCNAITNLIDKGKTVRPQSMFCAPNASP